MLLSAADRSACRGPSSDYEHRLEVMAMLDSLLVRYLDWAHEQSRLPQLVDGNDLMSALDLPPGPMIGRMLSAIRRAQEDHLISTAEEAIAVARTLVRDARG